MSIHVIGVATLALVFTIGTLRPVNIGALALIATFLVDSTPFSAVGALTLANSPEKERPQLFRVMLTWGLGMAVTAPVLTWLIFILPSAH